MWLREDGTPYYVGKGSGKRAFTNRDHVVRKPSNDRIAIIACDSEEEAFEKEIELIRMWGRKDLGTGILHNRTDGGDHPPCHRGVGDSEETRRKKSASAKLKVFTPEHRANIAAAKTGKKRGPLTPEWRANIAAANRGREYPKGGTPWNKGKTASLKAKINMSIAQTARFARQRTAQHGLQKIPSQTPALAG